MKTATIQDLADPEKLRQLLAAGEPLDLMAEGKKLALITPAKSASPVSMPEGYWRTVNIGERLRRIWGDFEFSSEEASKVLGRARDERRFAAQ